MNSEEDQLVREAQAGATDAFCLLARAYERRIYALAFHYSRDHQDAEDLSQEVWLKAYAALATFRFESSFYTWLRKIMINCFLNHRRTRSFSWRVQFNNNAAVSEHAAQTDAMAGAAALETTLQNRLVVARVMQILADVTPQQRLIFLLKHQEGMTYEEISKEIGCSIGAVKKSVSRTVSKLRQQLGVNDESENYISCAAGGY
ncbi:MAG: polymerase, sigma-24 subunit, subfamily [Acidobacteria bacterium]|nr:polymerase, sigma-24 subunit, subfamily [Acidobacteriota bacterium]